MSSTSVSATVISNFSAKETYTLTSTPQAASSTTIINHNGLDSSRALDSSTTPAITKVAVLTATLSGGALTLNLASLTGTEGETVDGTGLKVQVLKLSASSANTGAITIVPGASNGINLLGASSSLAVYPGGEYLLYFDDESPDISSSVRTLDLSGTGTEALSVGVLMG